MKISYINSVCVRNDAISNAIRDEFRFLREAGHEDVRLFAFTCDHPEIPFTRCESVSDIARHPHFLYSELVIFHFGIFYSLFNLFPIVPCHARKVAVFHNITPAELVLEKDRWLIEKSFAQLDNIRWADHVICDSHTNLGVLRSHGLTTPASVIPLAVHSDLRAPTNKPSFQDGILRILFVGRFTLAKGPQDLLAAIETIVADDTWNSPIQLDLVGNLGFSDPATVSMVKQKIAALNQRFADRLTAKLHGDATDEVKHALLQDADVFALPTYHEGFCVPIIEAIASGCKVLTYRNSNTPDVCGNLGTLVRTGDVDAFARSLRQLLIQGQSAFWRNGTGETSYTHYIDTSKRHVARLNPSNIASMFLRTIANITAR